MTTSPSPAAIDATPPADERDAFHAWHRSYGKNTQGIKWVDDLLWSCGQARAALASQVAQAPDLPAEPSGWIRVKDRLPKPGCDVLAFFRYPSTGKGRVVRAMHAPKFKISEDDFGEFLAGADHDEETDMTYWPEGWYETWEEGETSWALEHEPTHWQPLPSAPLAAADQPAAERIQAGREALQTHLTATNQPES